MIMLIKANLNILLEKDINLNKESISDGSRDKPFWRIDAEYRKNLTYCPYCGKKIDYYKIDKEIEYD